MGEESDVMQVQDQILSLSKILAFCSTQVLGGLILDFLKVMH